MKRPYLKKIGNFAGFKVYYVSGYWIRKNLDKEFTNFGQHYKFSFIPKDEFWIDHEHGRREATYFIYHLLREYRLMEEGKSYDEAIDEADIIEHRERSKGLILKRLRKIKAKETIIKKIHKKQILKNKSGKIKIWVIRGDLVRSLFRIDFTEGGHDKVYSFIPANEVWLDDDLYKKDVAFVLIHELFERTKMAKGMNYSDAHKLASELEFWLRHHPKSIRRILSRELKLINL